MKVCGKTVVIGKLLTNPVEEDGWTTFTIYNINFLRKLVLTTVWYEGKISENRVVRGMEKGDLCRIEGCRLYKKFSGGKLGTVWLTNAEIINK